MIVSTNSTEEPNRPAFNQQVQSIAQAEQAAGKNVRFVDMSALTPADLADELHTNDGGYQKMTDAFNAGVQAADAAGWIKAPVATGGSIRSGIVGKCLDVNGGSSANGTAGVVAAQHRDRRVGERLLDATVYAPANSARSALPVNVHPLRPSFRSDSLFCVLY